MASLSFFGQTAGAEVICSRREERIKELGLLFLDWMYMAELYGKRNQPVAATFCRTEAYAVMRERDAMVMSRTPEEVAALEQARGLA